jgi:hypothetical protein
MGGLATKALFIIGLGSFLLLAALFFISRYFRALREYFFENI